ncbi:MAG: ribonuclease HII [Intestinimonas sp.]|nr:ribonuclease HII [Intestinimonas sp.]
MKCRKERWATADLWELERACWGRGAHLVCGADEAGAGPLAGAVYAAAVILPRELLIPGLNDSKKLSPSKREALYSVIVEQAVAWAVASVDEAEIDRINILNARMLAMNKAICMLNPAPDYALIDGDKNRGISVPNETAVKGDGRSANIAAASILAKVSRDRYMVEMAQRYPQYEFERHKGYPTKRHYELLRKYGPCPIHRMTFLKKL